MAKIDVTKITGFDAMSNEDKLKALMEFDYNDNLSEVERYKNAVSKANSEAAEWKRKHNALLSDEEKKAQDTTQAFEDMKKELEQLKSEKLVASYTANYIAQGYDKKLAEDTAAALVSGDMDKVFTNGNKFLELHDKAVKSSNLDKTPTPEKIEVGKGQKVTKEQFDNMTYSERMDLYNSDSELYKALNTGGNE